MLREAGEEKRQQEIRGKGCWLRALPPPDPDHRAGVLPAPQCFVLRLQERQDLSVCGSEGQVQRGKGHTEVRKVWRKGGRLFQGVTVCLEQGPSCEKGSQTWKPSLWPESRLERLGRACLF